MEYNKETFEQLAKKYINRDGIKELLLCLEKSDFYTAPASTRFHDSIKGGLCKHSIRVFEELLKETDSEYSLESIALVSLFHDICKIGFYEETTRNVKDEATGKWHKEPFYKINDLFPLGHGEKSLFMINDCMKVTSDEALAIRWHMNGFEPKENYSFLSKAYNDCSLAVLLAIADLKATYLK